MLKKLIAIDSQYAYKIARRYGFENFPVREFRELVANGMAESDNYDSVDVIETLVTVIKFPPENDSPEAVASAATNFERIVYSLEMQGCRVVPCPVKLTPMGGYKQSDDQRLVVATLSACLKLRPDFLVLVAGDGDYFPMVLELRVEGIRTEVAALPDTLASDLRRAAWGVVDLEKAFEAINRLKEENDEYAYQG